MTSALRGHVETIPVTSLCEYRLNRDCERIAFRRGDGLITIRTHACAYTVGPAVARVIAEYANEALSRILDPVDINGWTISRRNMLGAVVVRAPHGELMPMGQAQAEVFALALARVVGP